MDAVLITRPEPAATATAALLAERGHRAIVAPFLLIEPLVAKPAPRTAACLITSANAAHAIPPRTPVFAVGDATAAQARQITDAPVYSAQGDAQALLALVKQRCAPHDGPLLLLCGEAQGLLLAALLREAGFGIIRRCVYRAMPPRRFPAFAASAMAQGEIGTVLFYSPETARAFTRLLPKTMMPCLARIRALCLSPAIARMLGGAFLENGSPGAGPWREKISAKRPTQEDLLGLLMPATRNFMR